jgi:hypothetical protein
MFNAIPIKISITERKINPQVHVEAQKTANSQSNPEQNEQHWKYHTTRL